MLGHLLKSVKKKIQRIMSKVKASTSSDSSESGAIKRYEVHRVHEAINLLEEHVKRVSGESSSQSSDSSREASLNKAISLLQHYASDSKGPEVTTTIPGYSNAATSTSTLLDEETLSTDSASCWTMWSRKQRNRRRQKKRNIIQNLRADVRKCQASIDTLNNSVTRVTAELSTMREQVSRLEQSCAPKKDI